MVGDEKDFGTHFGECRLDMATCAKRETYPDEVEVVPARAGVCAKN